MKRAILIALAFAAVLLVSSCSLFDKSYYWEYSYGSIGLCEEVKTSDSSIRADLIDEGFAEGTCSSQGYATAESCSTTVAYNGDTVDVAIYFSNGYIDAIETSGSSIKTVCESDGWTYNN
jgi:hypothetical protein